MIKGCHLRTGIASDVQGVGNGEVVGRRKADLVLKRWGWVGEWKSASERNAVAKRAKSGDWLVSLCVRRFAALIWYELVGEVYRIDAYCKPHVAIMMLGSRKRNESVVSENAKKQKLRPLPAGPMPVLPLGDAEMGTSLNFVGCHQLKVLRGGGEGIAGPPGGLRLQLGSACSGSGLDMHIVDALVDNLREVLGVEVSVEIVFLCEIDKTKLQWCREVGDYTGHPCCCFTNIAHLHSEVADCERHSGQCRVKPCDIFLVGTSCKLFSRANSVVRSSGYSGGKALAQDGGESSSKVTFDGAINYIKKHQPSIVVIENTDAVTDEGADQGPEDGNFVVIVTTLMACNYDVQPFKLNCKQHALPQARQRFYCLSFLKTSPLFKTDSFDAVFDCTKRGLALGRVAPPPLQAFLLADDCDVVTNELCNRLSRKSFDGDMSQDKWPIKHLDWCRANKVRWPYVAVSASDKSSPWYSLLEQREKEVLAASHRAEPVPMAVDVGQSLGRVPVSLVARVGPHDVEILPTQLPNGKTWLSIFPTGDFPKSKHHRLLIGREALSAQGYPWQRLPTDMLAKYGESFLHDLAGNAYPGTVMLALLSCAFMCVQWHEPVQVRNSQTLESVLGSLGLRTGVMLSASSDESDSE